MILPKKRMTTNTANACQVPTKRIQPNIMGNEQNEVVQPLLTDLYQIKMAYAYWQAVSCDGFLPRTHAHSHTRFSAARTSHARVRFAKI